MPKRVRWRVQDVQGDHAPLPARRPLDRVSACLQRRPTPVGQIVDVADARESMPAKSTFFHPKVPSGLVIHPLLA